MCKVVFADAATPGPSTVLTRDYSSAFILLALLAIGGLAYGLYRIGFISVVIRIASAVVRGGVRAGFRLWERCFSFASWPVFVAILLGLITTGSLLSKSIPLIAVLCGLTALVMGVTACLAYMYLDLERYQVERGYKAVHDPLKGQELAADLIRHGDQVGVALLAAAAIGAIGGFALLNEGLYGSFGSKWYTTGDDGSAGYMDFVSYTIINLYRIVDILDMAGSYNILRFSYVRQAMWPAATLLMAFKTFFTLVLLQQIFASIRQGQALAESISDFWSPHPPIHERARNSLPQHGVGVVRPLLASLREVPALTKEQRDQLPRVIAGIGPASIPALLEHVNDSHEGVRGVSVAALGMLQALDALPSLAHLKDDPSDLVRQEVMEALGLIGGPGMQMASRWSRVAKKGVRSSRFRWTLGRRGRGAEAHQPDRVELAVSALRSALTDPVAAVRVAAARALGQIGPAAASTTQDLIVALKDDDETACCAAAAALGDIGDATAVPALASELASPSPAVREAAAQALGAFGRAAHGVASALVALLQDPEESVRNAAGQAVSKVGPLNEEATESLVEGLSSPDTLVQAQTAEVLGTIGEGAVEAAPALVEALQNGTDHVRAKAAEALGKIGETAAEVAVPTLVRALRDEDNWVSALAAEALGEMGEAAEGAVPALVKSLKHINPLVRANAAEALGKLGASASSALAALEKAACDEDGGVRAQALGALAEVAPEGNRRESVVQAALQDPEPRVRAAAAETLGKMGVAKAEATELLLPLLEDANDQVKYQVVRALGRLAGPESVVVESLCRRLLEDDSPWIQEVAAQTLGQLGPAAASAGPALLRTAQTGEIVVREEALRAIVLIQPPETAEALIGGMIDANPDVRKMASAGWMKAAEIPESAIPALVEALKDPEVQVRANAAHALSRLKTLPAESIPLLIECASDPSDGLRLNAVVALQDVAPEMGREVLHRLMDDPNSRIRLIAAGAILTKDPRDAAAATVIAMALADTTLRLRQIGFEIIAAMGNRGIAFLDSLRRCAAEDEDATLRDRAAKLVAQLEAIEAVPEQTGVPASGE